MTLALARGINWLLFYARNCKDHLPLRSGSHAHLNRYLQWIIRPRLNFYYSLHLQLAHFLLKYQTMNGAIALRIKPTPASFRTPFRFIPWSKVSLFLFLTKNKWITRITGSNLDDVKIDVSGLLLHRFSYCTKSVRSANWYSINKKELHKDKWGYE
jgi:hypothetical protein